MATGPIETHLHHSFNWENGAPGAREGPRGRSVDCGSVPSAQCVRLRSEINLSYFNDSLVEIMKQNGRGTKGHIGFAVNDIDAAEKWFAERGLEVNEESRALLPDGSTKLVYFKREFAGFAVHLCRE